jgi:hypothetical protein
LQKNLNNLLGPGRQRSLAKAAPVILSLLKTASGEKTFRRIALRGPGQPAFDRSLSPDSGKGAPAKAHHTVPPVDKPGPGW